MAELLWVAADILHDYCMTVVQVLDEIGVDVSAQMGSAPTKKLAAQQHAPSEQQSEENDSLTARLAALK